MQPTPHANAMQIDLPAHASLVSKADLEGNITYANDALVQASGFSLEELIGKPHRIMRHPDVPEAVYNQLWKTLRSGLPWQGILKNGGKNGVYYWTNACIVPIQRNDQITGFMFVFKPATPADIEAAQLAYRNNSVPAGHKSKFPALFGVRSGIRAGFLFVALLILSGGVLGIGGLNSSDAALTRMYQNQFEPVAAVGQIEARLREVRNSILESNSATSALPESQVISNLQNTFDEIQEIFESVHITADAKDSASTALASSLRQYSEEGRTLLYRTASTAPTQLNTVLKQQLLELESKATLSANALRQALVDAAQQEFSGALERNKRIRTLAFLGIIAGLLIIALMGQRFVRNIVNPLNGAIHRLNRIAQGDLQTEIRLTGTDETAQLNNAAVVMQQHLKVMLDEIGLAARHIQQHCQTLNQSLYGVTEHSEAQHDQVHSAIRALNKAVAETSDLSQRAERLMHMASTADTAGDVTTSLESETRELATATRLAAFGAEEVAGSMRQVADLIVENRGEAQLAWQASEELMRTANELNNLVDFFEPHKQKLAPASMP